MAVINHFIDGSAHTALLCDNCWTVRRHEVGSEMTEGPITWGEDWPETLAWLERSLANGISPRVRHLVAVELARQLWHLPTPILAAARQLLGELGLGAS